MVRLFHIQDTTRVDAIIAVEKVVDALQKEDDRVESELIKQVEHEVATSQVRLQRGEGVQYRAVGRVARKKMIKPCKTCCCVLHCQVTEHEHRHKVHYSYGKDNLFDNMLDRSWQGLDEFEDEMCVPVNKDNTIMFLICSDTLDLVDEYEEEMCSLANKDNTLLSLMCPVNLDLTDVVTEDL